MSGLAKVATGSLALFCRFRQPGLHGPFDRHSCTPVSVISNRYPDFDYTFGSTSDSAYEDFSEIESIEQASTNSYNLESTSSSSPVEPEKYESRSSDDVLKSMKSSLSDAQSRLNILELEEQQYERSYEIHPTLGFIFPIGTEVVPYSSDFKFKDESPKPLTISAILRPADRQVVIYKLQAVDTSSYDQPLLFETVDKPSQLRFARDARKYWEARNITRAQRDLVTALKIHISSLQDHLGAGENAVIAGVDPRADGFLRFPGYRNF